MRRFLPALLVWAMGHSCFGQDASSVANEEQQKESLITAAYQKGYNANKQKIFLAYMLKGGTATAIMINSVKITQWVDGQPTGLPDDVQQFVVDFTIFWTSKLHPNDGNTEIRAVYVHQPGMTHCVGSQIVSSNGITQDGALKAVEKVLGGGMLH